jgi:hypothetical protein
MNEFTFNLPLLAWDWPFGAAFSDLLPSQRFVLLLALIGCTTIAVISIVAVVSGTVQSMHRSRVEADLKRDMLDRGMPADEIARVIESTTPKDFLDRWASNQGAKKSA